MLIKTIFTQHDYACRTDTNGGVKSLTAEFIKTVCVKCPARLKERLCIRNIVTVEKRLAELLGTPPTTRKCARENCDRHILITPENKDVVTLVCDWCLEREADELRRTICKIPGCTRQGFKDGICQTHYWQRRGGRPCRAVGGCKSKPVPGETLCDKHLRQRAALNAKRQSARPHINSNEAFGFPVYYRH